MSWSWFKSFWSINSYSYTCLILLYAVLNGFGLFPPLIWQAALIMFAMTSCITIAINLADRLTMLDMWLVHLLRLVLIGTFVFGLGYFFNLMPFERPYLIATGAMIVVIYAAVYGLMYVQMNAEAKEVNAQLSKFKERFKEGQREQDHRN